MNMEQKKQLENLEEYPEESFTIKLANRFILFKCLLKQDKCVKIYLEFSSVPLNENTQSAIKSELILFLNGNKNNVSSLFSLTCNEKSLMVYKKLMKTPFGETLTYSDLANKTGLSNPRFVGNILSKNPLPIVIPCHRIIGKDKTLRGYAFGVEMKRSLLTWEAKKNETWHS
jgi:O-6-methylguanine DNA methyltransferase